MKKLLTHEKCHYDECEFKEIIGSSNLEIELPVQIEMDKNISPKVQRNFCEFSADTMSYILENRSRK